MGDLAPSWDALVGQVAEVSRRLSELEERVRSATPEPGAEAASIEAYWALPKLRERLQEVARGGVIFTGSVVGLDGELVEWERSEATESVLSSDWSEAADTLGALGHPVRLRLIQALAGGRTAVTELVELEGLGTTGQIYHHLRQLVSAGWLETTGRGQYQIPPSRLVPLLVVVTGARR
ncbi:ArsR/SmtB family transcription factor [Streptomyces anulatus]|uniref:ArsR/SmtB family transcription factor n=1 Tax=Streptomyces anulatus TaxID=1892 RepID=UPI001C5DB8F0|nr:helix-turn-helix domain-containing protein [Streptomyces anulatus]QYA98164.1 helix-turn-helix domain-containing protein [Streptomyces anulatus]WSU33142.1 helix-turn-helix domain-containing protein [Streptomyces anulatus]WSU87942.1 helix-turn-helix domain-containing protein [Streptomyces anulatus]